MPEGPWACSNVIQMVDCNVASIALQPLNHLTDLNQPGSLTSHWRWTGHQLENIKIFKTTSTLLSSKGHSLKTIFSAKSDTLLYSLLLVWWHEFFIVSFSPLTSNLDK